MGLGLVTVGMYKTTCCTPGDDCLCLEVNHKYEDMEPNGKRLLRLLMYCLLATFDTMHILCYFLHILSRGFRVC